MAFSLEIREVAVVVLATSHNPTILNPDFLERNAIVEEDWELAGDPLCMPGFAQVSYTNGVTIAAELGKLAFSQAGHGRSGERSCVSDIAAAYIRTLPHVTYSAIGSNITGCVVVDSDEAARAFVADRLIADGAWMRVASSAPIASAKFIYDIRDARAAFSVDPGRITVEDGDEFPVVRFAVNFHRELAGEAADERNRHAEAILGDWPADLGAFRSIVEDTFLPTSEE
jgi:hypothetical protein